PTTPIPFRFPADASGPAERTCVRSMLCPVSLLCCINRAQIHVGFCPFGFGKKLRKARHCYHGQAGNNSNHNHELNYREPFFHTTSLFLNWSFCDQHRKGWGHKVKVHVQLRPHPCENSCETL